MTHEIPRNDYYEEIPRLGTVAAGTSYAIVRRHSRQFTTKKMFRGMTIGTLRPRNRINASESNFT